MTLFLPSSGIGITNPAAILTVLFALSCFESQAKEGVFNGLLLVGGGFLGTYFRWTALTAAAYILKTRSKMPSPKNESVFGVDVMPVQSGRIPAAVPLTPYKRGSAS